MTELDFLTAIGKVDQKYVGECLEYKAPSPISVFAKRAAAFAACAVIAVSAVLAINHFRKPDPIDPPPVIINENGFYIENGVLLSYTGDETDVVIPEEVNTIANNSFSGNSNVGKIQTVRLTSNVKVIEYNAFAGMDDLSKIIIDEGNSAFVEKDGLTLSADGLSLIKYNRTDETHFTIPESVRYVVAHAVQSTDLESIDFGNNLEYIGFNAFASNRKLKSIYLPKSLIYIEKGAFDSCVKAVDGYVPETVKFGGEAFNYVPFWMSLKAGQPCPQEEIAREKITPAEALLKSDLESLQQQIDYVMAQIRGESPEHPTWGINLNTSGCTVPDDLILPDEITVESFTLENTGWDSPGNNNVKMLLNTGKYTVVIGAYAYAPFDSLYWKDVRFRTNTLYIYTNSDNIPEEDKVVSGDWTAVFDKTEKTYQGVTFYHTDGRVVKVQHLRSVNRPYKLIYSPDCSKVLIEYPTDYLYSGFTVYSLTNETLRYNGFSNYYPGKPYPEYVANTVEWLDNDNVGGINAEGGFVFNVYNATPKQIRHTAIKHATATEQKKEIYKIMSLQYMHCKNLYGEALFSYSENGSGKPVYSLPKFPGVMVAYNKPVTEPIEEWRTPNEIILTKKLAHPFLGMRVGENYEDRTEVFNVDWEISYDPLIESYIMTAEYDYYNITVIIKPEGSASPTSEEQQAFASAPEGEILQIRISK